MTEVDGTLRQRVLALFEQELPTFPVRWADGRTLHGDFEGHESALEIFNVPPEEQRRLRLNLRPVRKTAEAILGRPILLLFHSPEATAMHYGEIVSGATEIENAVLSSELVVRGHGDLSLPFPISVKPFRVKAA